MDTPLLLHASFPAVQLNPPPHYERLLVLTIVILMHIAAFFPFLLRSEPPRVALNEMSVSVAIRQAEIAQAQPLVSPVEPSPKQERIKTARVMPIVRDLADTAVASVPVVDKPGTPDTAHAPDDVPVTKIATAAMADTEPDFKADYLNNPRPPYPSVARRWGWEGRVILNVQVLAEGTCGLIEVLNSSGRESFDNAALQTVKGWRFIPARHAGHPVTKWFKVPINFSLQDKEI
ncbi:MAG: energy transducer TonB [Gallionella sp.]|nr:energy transducer TonB [Gallionella sp.]